ncbi:MAG: glycosyltransferase family 39 protein [Acidobacteriaceae bacterium]
MTESSNTETSQPFRAPWTIFWIALLVRIAYMTFAHTWHMRPYEDHFAFGYEMGRIARALATGYGFADSFRGHTGPTAWVPPIYPWILTADFKLFGVYTALSAWMILSFDCVLNALIIRPVWEIAARCFSRRTALWSAWIWALYPAAMQYAVKWVWEMTLSAFLFSWVFVLALRMRRVGAEGEATPSARNWAWFGLLWGLIALTNPSLCLFLPPCGVWILLGVPRTTLWRRQIPAAVLSACVFIACLAPWTYRNWRVFHAFVPVRANLGVELYLGNGPGATGLLMGYDHPFEDAPQLRLYHQMGEIAYAKMRGNLAKKIIAADPGRFAKLCLRRVYYFWFSLPHPTDPHWYNVVGRNLNYQFTSIAALLGLALALRRRAPAAWLFFWAFLLLPLTYYAVTVHARFRHPLEPLMAILTVYLFQSAKKSWAVRGFRRSRQVA